MEIVNLLHKHGRRGLLPLHLIPLLNNSIESIFRSQRSFEGFESDRVGLIASDDMGQVLDRCQGKHWRRKQIRAITDKVYDRIKDQSGKANLGFEDLYIGVLLVYNDLNKRLPGPHFDPPSKEQVRALMQACDIDLDRELDREEFVRFIQQLTADTFIVISQGLILTLVIAPTIAMATKRATEGVPGVGRVVQRLPNSVYASLVTLAAVMFQKACQESE